jgi:glucose-6-phosphate 1-dehydrogenase
VIERLLIPGISGDLAARKLAPALAALVAANQLPERFSVVGMARHPWDDAALKAHMHAALARHAAELGPHVHERLLEMFEYRAGDVTDPAALAHLLDAAGGEPALLYMALPPRITQAVAEQLSEVSLPRGARIVCEKPFGTNLRAAEALNRTLSRTVPEDGVFRVDHFLMKQTVQNILGLRFGNRLFESAWNREHVDRVEIVFDEAVALEGRAGYYDRAGALRDMIQSHLLQLVCLLAMEAPQTLGERDLRDRKVQVLRAVRRMSPEEVGRHTVRARYTAGRTGEQEVPDYVDEPGVDAERATETFAEVVLHVDNWRWAGVPFVLRSGKALARDRRTIAVHFRRVPHIAFKRSEPCGNVLRLDLDPDRMALAVNVNAEGEPFRLVCIALDAELPAQRLPAYARLLADALEGDVTLSIRGDEAEEAWRIVTPILDAWAAGRAPLREYPAGSAGPAGPLGPGASTGRT